MKNEDYIGRCFERKLRNEYTEEKYCFKILREEEKYFVVVSYGLYLGFSTMEINSRMEKDFLKNKNFREISRSEFDTIVYLCRDPYTTVWDENNCPTYLPIKRVKKENDFIKRLENIEEMTKELMCLVSKHDDILINKRE
ncbi:hypothetical protein F140042L4_20290 [Coprococcus phoceensis]